MQLCVNNASERSLRTKRIMDKCQAIPTFYRNFTSGMDALYKEQDKLRNQRLEQLAVNAIRWNSRYTITGRIFKVIGAIEAVFNQMNAGTAVERTKFAKNAPGMLDNQEIAVLGEILEVLSRWLNSYIEQVRSIIRIYRRIHRTGSVLESLTTEPTLELLNMDRLTKDSWSPEDIPDVVLLTTSQYRLCIIYHLESNNQTLEASENSVEGGSNGWINSGGRVAREARHFLYNCNMNASNASGRQRYPS